MPAPRPSPNNYFVHALSPDLRVGFGLHSPFGLATDYGASWSGAITRSPPNCRPST